MIPVYIVSGEFTIKNIGADELVNILACINESKDNYSALGRDRLMNADEIKQRYLESLMNSLEYFCGIYLKDKLIGIIKGRIENKNDTELWILSYLFLKDYRRVGNGTKILQIFEEYFLKNYSIGKLCVLIMENNENGKAFWIKNGYKIARVTKSVGSSNISEMIIFEKKSEI